MKIQKSLNLRVRQLFISLLLLCTVSFCPKSFAGYKRLDARTDTSKIWQDTRVLFDTTNNSVPDYAKGHVKFRDGFVIDPGVTVALDIVDPICNVIDAGPGGINVGATGEIRLKAPIKLAANATMPHGAIIDGLGHTIAFDGNFELPSNKRLRIMSDTVLDGRGHTVTFGQDSQLILDHGVTVTLKNMTIKNTRNGYFKQIFTPLGPTSRVCLRDVTFDLHDDIYFKLGRLYVHSNVIVSGPHTFMYRSDQPSYIASCAQLAFENDSAFNYNPTTTADNLIKLVDHSSSIMVNGANLASYATPLRLTAGTLYFDNDVTLSSKISRPNYWVGAMSYMLTPTSLIGESSLTSVADTSDGGAAVNTVSWSSDGKYLAVGYASGATNEVHVYQFTGSGLTSVETARSDNTTVNSVDWSPDGKYLAVGYASGAANEVRVYVFSGLGLLAVTSVHDNNTTVNSVHWSPDGNYLAVGYKSGAASEVRVYLFDDLRLTSVATATETGNANFVSWSPCGCYLAVGFDTAAANEVQVYRFDGSSLTSIVIASDNNTTVNTLDWSPDGTYLAVGYDSGAVLSEVQVYEFAGTSLTLTVTTASDNNASVNSVHWSPDGNYLAVGYESGATDGEVHVYRFSGLGLIDIETISSASGVSANTVNWPPNGSYVAVGFDTDASDSEVHVYAFDHELWTSVPTSSMLLDKYDVGTVGLDSRDTKSSTHDVSSVSWTSDGRHLAVGFNVSGDTSAVQVYSFDGTSLGTAISLPETVSGAVTLVDWSPDGSWLAVGFANGATNEVIVYRFDGSELVTLGAWAVSNSGKTAYSVKWSPSGAYLAVGFESGTDDEVVIYRFSNNGLITTGATASSANDSDAYSVSWTPDESYVAVGYATDASDDEVKVYEFTGNSLIDIGVGVGLTSESDANVVSWSPDGSYLAVGFANDLSDEEVQVFKYEYASLSLTSSRSITGSGGKGVKSLDWSPDGAYFAVGYESDSAHDEIQVYQFTEWGLVDIGVGVGDNNARANAVRWSPDGAHLAAGFASGAVTEVHVYSFGDAGLLSWDSNGFIFGDSSIPNGAADLDVRVLGRAQVRILGHVIDDTFSV